MLGGDIRRRISLTIAALVCAAVLVPPVAADECPPDDLTCGTSLEWAIDLERKIADHIWDGQIYEVDYAPNAPRTRENITSVNHFGDSALWTGTYLASQSFRYAIAKEKLAGGLTGLENAFWVKQRNEAKKRVRQIVAKYEVLVNISRYWNHEFNPSTTQAGFGGGVIAGEPGYLMRACIPADTPEAYRWSDDQLGPDATGQPRPYTKDRRIFGPFDWPNDDGTTTTYFCEDGTSRDAYAGVTFGLQTAFDLVGADDAGLRKQVANDLVTLSNFAFKYLWTTPRPHGRISIPVGSNHASSPCTEINAVLPICGHDFENFVSPLFVITPFARMNMALGAKHVASATNHPDAAKWEAIFAEEVATQGPILAMSMEFDAMQPYESYYKHNLSHLIGYNITTRAPSPELRTLFKQAVGAMDNSTRDDVNAHFEAITYALTGEGSRLNDALTHLVQWRDYRTRIETEAQTNNEQHCGTSIECVPRDQLDIIPPGGGDTITVPGTSTDLRARYPLPVANRPPTDFLWQRAPNQLNGGESLLHQTPGIDYLLPYWMLRYHTEVVPPALEPFPLWPGPTHN